jgi:salicylate hydroxylase
MRRLSIGIAGAGPAGLATALLLSRDGHAVTIFEQFEEARPLGSGLILQPTGLAVLGELGLRERIESLGARIDRLFGRTLPSRRTILDVRYRRLAAGYGLAVHRAALFHVLYDAVLADGIAIETRWRVAGVADADSGRALVDERGRSSPRFDLVVDALGVRSPLWHAFGGGVRRDLPYGALWASLPWPGAPFDAAALEQRYSAASTMIGVLPIGRRREGQGPETAFFWSIRHVDYPEWRRRGLDAWKERAGAFWPETAPLLDAIADADEMTLARYGHQMLANPVARGLVAIGDAYHAASPQLGQGANMALLDGWTLREALRSERHVDEALSTYATARRRQMLFYQALSAGFTPFYQSDSRTLPPLRDWFVAPATRLPVLRSFVAASVAGLVLAPRGLMASTRRK